MRKNPKNTLLFHQDKALKTLINGEQGTTLLGTAEQPLAECQPPSQSTDQKLLANDQQGSVVNVATEAGLPSLSYTPYGFSTPEHRSHSALAYNGERPDVFALYLLGSYRGYNSIIMRFHSPDSFSPFGDGGINTYGYCLGNPINNTDPSGHLVFTRTWKLNKIFRSDKVYFDQKNIKIERLQKKIQSYTNILKSTNKKTQYFDIERTTTSYISTQAITRLNKEIDKHRDLINKNTPYISTVAPREEAALKSTQETVAIAKLHNKKYTSDPYYRHTKPDKTFFETQIFGSTVRNS